VSAVWKDFAADVIRILCPPPRSWATNFRGKNSGSSSSSPFMMIWWHMKSPAMLTTGVYDKFSDFSTTFCGAGSPAGARPWVWAWCGC